MTNNTIYFGVIDEFEDYDKASIIFHIPNLVEAGRAYSMFPEKKPAIGDEVILFKMNSQLNAMWYYLNINQTGEFIMEYNGANIFIKDGKIYIQADNGINFGNKVEGRETQDGTEAMVYGTKLSTWLKKLIDVLTYEFSVLTSSGPSGTATPATIMKLKQLNANIDKLISDYASSVDDKGELSL